MQLQTWYTPAGCKAPRQHPAITASFLAVCPGVLTTAPMIRGNFCQNLITLQIALRLRMLVTCSRYADSSCHNLITLPARNRCFVNLSHLLSHAGNHLLSQQPHSGDVSDCSCDVRQPSHVSSVMYVYHIYDKKASFSIMPLGSGK